MAAKKAPAKKMAAPAKAAPKKTNKTGSAAQFRMKEEADKKKMKASTTPRSSTFGKGRTDAYGSMGFGQTQSNVDNDYSKRVEATARAALKAISGKSPNKGEPITGSEHSWIRTASIKGLKLTGAQQRYVEEMIARVPYQPKRRGPKDK